MGAPDPADGTIVADKRAPQPNTKFDGVFVGTDDKVDLDRDGSNEQANGGDDDTGTEFDAQRMADQLNDHPGWAAGSQDIIVENGAPTIGNLNGDGTANVDNTGATEKKIRDRIIVHCLLKQPGEEFIFYISSHGAAPPDWRLIVDAGPGNPPPADNDGKITGAELRDMLSCFLHSVTVTVIIDACFSGNFIAGGFAAGIKNSEGHVMDQAHLSVMTSASATCPAAAVPRNRGAGENPDVNGYWGALFTKHLENCLNPDGAPIADNNPADGVVTAQELFDCANTATRADPQYDGQDPQFFQPPVTNDDDDGVPPDTGDGYTAAKESGTPLCGNAKNDDDKVGPGLTADDAVVDDGCPAGPAQVGAFSEANFKIGTDPNLRCGVGNEGAGVPSGAWPSDFVSAGIPNSTDRINITDLTSFLAPARHLNTAPGQPNFDKRWDLIPGRGLFTPMINVTDLTALIAASSGFPPMLGGAKAFSGPVCPGD